MTLSIILPCFNEEANIESTVRDTAGWMRGAGITGSIIVVDDGSKDASPRILDRLRQEMPELRVVTHDRNQGYGVAVRSGCDAATTDLIGFMDSDGQFTAEEFALLLPHLEQAPFVTGRRRKRADSFIRNTFGKVLGAMNVVMLGLWVRDVNCGLKVFRREIWPVIRPIHGVEKLFNTEMFLKLKQRSIPWVQVDVPHYPRRAGTPTGGSLRVIGRMFRELRNLRRSRRHERRGEAERALS